MEPSAAVHAAALQAAKSWGWSDADAEDLAKNAEILHATNGEDSKLKGRPLKEFWDVNTTSVLEAHRSRISEGEVRTRFPPEPNGFAHFGHAKSMHMNFFESFERIHPAPKYRHVTFRLDDTNPEAESQEYVDKLLEAVLWLGWVPQRTTYTSDYFPQMFDFALQLIKQGDAYVCFQTGADIEHSRKQAKLFHAGDATAKPESPWRNASVEENLSRFIGMKEGLYEENECSLRLKMDMFHVNPNLWDPVAYRIMYHGHPRSKDTWCIYPTYDYSHCIVDSLEDIEYSICTLEFETRRESYYWLLWKLNLYRPKVFEFARLEVTQMVMSKRKLKKLVDTHQVRGWDDCRMPTLMGMKRRGFLPSEINQFMKEIGVTRSQSVVDVNRFYQLVSGKLELESPRCFGLVDPVVLELTNVPEDRKIVISGAKKFPQMENNSKMRSDVFLTRNIFVDRDSICTQVNDDFYGLQVGKTVRLRYGPLVRCVSIQVDPKGQIEKVVGEAIFAEGDESFELNTKDADSAVASKGVLHWLSPQSAMSCELRLYEQLMTEDMEELNPQSERVFTKSLVERAFIEELLATNRSLRFQMERVGFFCVDEHEKTLVLNRILPLQQSAHGAASSAASSLGAGKSRKEERMAQEAAKAERLKYSCEEFFKRPDQTPKFKTFDAEGFPTSNEDGSPLSKSQFKTLKKELEKHKKELEEDAKRKAKQ